MRSAAFSLACFAAAALSGCAARHENGRAAVRTPVPANVARGKSIYFTQCAACHGERGAGGQVGPDLRGEGLRKSDSAIRTAILDPEPPMPKLFPSELTQSDVRDVAAFVETL